MRVCCLPLVERNSEESKFKEQRRWAVELAFSRRVADRDVGKSPCLGLRRLFGHGKSKKKRRFDFCCSSLSVRMAGLLRAWSIEWPVCLRKDPPGRRC